MLATTGLGASTEQDSEHLGKFTQIGIHSAQSGPLSLAVQK